MTVRTSNCLAQAGIRTKAQLLAFVDEHGTAPLMSLPNFGAGCRAEVEIVVAEERKKAERKEADNG